jgi:hypothetical protein
MLDVMWRDGSPLYHFSEGYVANINFSSFDHSQNRYFYHHIVVMRTLDRYGVLYNVSYRYCGEMVHLFIIFLKGI